MSTIKSNELDFNEPAKVTDIKSFKEYLKWKKHPILNQLKIQTCTDGTVVNLALIKPKLEALIMHLPEEEREHIMTLKKKYGVVHSKANGYKTAAYRRAGDPIGRKSILDQKEPELIELFGRMFTDREVHKICIEDFKLDVGIKAIQDFRKRHITTILQKIEEFKRDYSDIRLSIKKSRLEELVFLYGQRKQIYLTTKKESDYKLLIQTLEQVRKESEGNSLLIHGKFEIEQDVQIQAHLRQEVFKQLNIKQIILGRIASKMGTNPLLLQKTILDSYYGKYFNTENFHELQPPTPTQETYDFNRIGQLVIMNDEQNKRFIEAENAKIQQVTTIEETQVIKQGLLEKLLRMSGAASNVKDGLKK